MLCHDIWYLVYHWISSIIIWYHQAKVFKINTEYQIFTSRSYSRLRSYCSPYWILLSSIGRAQPSDRALLYSLCSHNNAQSDCYARLILLERDILAFHRHTVQCSCAVIHMAYHCKQTLENWLEIKINHSSFNCLNWMVGKKCHLYTFQAKFNSS